MKLFLLFSVAFLSIQSWSQIAIPSSYDNNFVNDFRSNHLQNVVLINKLNQLTAEHHEPIGYEKAKDYIFGQLFLEKTESGKYAVTDVYCEKQFTDSDFGQPTFGPMKSPTSGNIMNTEHTWPQSRFTMEYPKGTQKADLHHLFPTDSQMNNNRGNLKFGEVQTETVDLKCDTARLGQEPSDKLVIFEAPVKHRGNVARALFYFSVRYNLDINPIEELFLRQWDKEDPADNAEIDRNSQIEKIQGNRNPFVDFPDLVDHIKAFNHKAY